MNHLSKTLLVIVLFLAMAFAFITTSWNGLCEWDEARNGVNAYEMCHSGDYVNYYYSGSLDTWNAKPPLLLWMIASSYKVFGFNEFALRFPAAVCTVLFFFVFFRLVEKLENSLVAFLSCLLLFSCKAIFWDHIGITADYETPLLLFMTAAAYSFVLYIDKDKMVAIYMTAIFTGLAFYTKGPVALVYIPGFILYGLLRKKGISFFKDYRLWLSVVCFLLIAGSWILLVSVYGKTAEHSFYGSKNSIETMLVHDTYRRMVSSDFGEYHTPDYWYLFAATDVRFNIWSYLLYLGIVIAAFGVYRNSKSMLSFLRNDNISGVVFSILLITPLCIVLTFAIGKHDWYLAPAFGFLAFLIVKVIMWFAKKWRPAYLVFGILFIFLFARHSYSLMTKKHDMHTFMTNSSMLVNGATCIIMPKPTRQDVFLYMVWLGKRIIQTKPTNISGYKGQLIVLEKVAIGDYPQHLITPIKYYREYCIGIIN